MSDRNVDPAGVGSAPMRAGRYRVVLAEGRGSPMSPGGLPPAARVLLVRDDEEDGQEIIFGVRRPRGQEYRGQVLAVAEPGISPLCPICLTPEPTEREHVPQGKLGGHVMTLTCARCNNALGSRVEVDLQDWYDVAARAKVTLPGLRGARKMPRFLQRESSSGEVVWLFDTGCGGPEVEAALSRELSTGGGLTLDLIPATRAAYKTAALKHAYLAACLLLGSVPRGGLSDLVREELLRARDTPRSAPLQIGEQAGHLRLRRTGFPPRAEAVLLVEWPLPDGPRTEILLAGTIGVSWPLESELLELVVARARKLTGGEPQG